jgi:hypothetical protein
MRISATAGGITNVFFMSLCFETGGVIMVRRNRYARARVLSSVVARRYGSFHSRYLINSCTALLPLNYAAC